MNKNSETKQSESNSKLQELFIEDLGRVSGGFGGGTTFFFGEEEVQTTLAIGEEDDGNDI